MFGLSPWLLLGAAGAALVSFGGGYFKGNADAAHRYQATIATMKAQAAEDAQHAAQAMLIQSSNAATGLEAGNAKARVIYKTITQQVDHVVEMPVYRNICFDDAGLQLANAALGGVPTAPAAISQSNSGMPRSLAPQ